MSTWKKASTLQRPTGKVCFQHFLYINPSHSVSPFPSYSTCTFSIFFCSTFECACKTDFLSKGYYFRRQIFLRYFRKTCIFFILLFQELMLKAWLCQEKVLSWNEPPQLHKNDASGDTDNFNFINFRVTTVICSSSEHEFLNLEVCRWHSRVFTCVWYSRTGISSSSVGPNWRRAAEKRMATAKASFKLVMEIPVIIILPEDKDPRAALKRSLPSWMNRKHRMNAEANISSYPHKDATL